MVRVGNNPSNRNWRDDSLSIKWDVKLVLKALLLWMIDQHLYGNGLNARVSLTNGTPDLSSPVSFQPIETHKNSLTVIKPESLPNAQSNAQGGGEGDTDAQDAQVQDFRSIGWSPSKATEGTNIYAQPSQPSNIWSTPFLSVEYSDLLVETDSLLFVSWFRNSSQSTWMYFELWNDVLDIGSNLPFDISHTYREEISLADGSANLGAAWHDNFFPSVLHLPKHLAGLLSLDKYGIPNPRHR
ncbi:uncharacterized protein LOC122274430 [Carya illinoinensis]|uniref:uncharacterized protein LOC122274430 n=1 Tax=Carya illinoinensis TaxID=32201 RepID=UPI001C729428|nr:uncharacterized protein LOC122274430 [Carya illinoinensis]